MMHKIFQNMFKMGNTGKYSTLHYVPTKLKFQFLQPLVFKKDVF